VKINGFFSTLKAFFQSFTDFLQFEFLIYGFCACILFSFISSILSPLVTTKRQTFQTTTLSHTTFLSLGLGFLILTNPSPYQLFLLGFLLSVIFGQFLSLASFKKKLPAENFIGLYSTGAMALGILLMEKNPYAAQKISTYLFGNLLTVEPFQVSLLFLISILTFIFFKVFEKDLFIWCWESDEVVNSLENPFFIQSLIYLLLTFTFILGHQIIGLFGMSSLLVLPSLSASLLTNNKVEKFKFSFLFAFPTIVLSAGLSNFFNYSIGPTICAFQLFIFLIVYTVVKLKTPQPSEI
jgi:zinc transport system permease protein